MSDKLQITNAMSEYRNRAGITQQQLADLLGVSRQTINSIERGRTSISLELAFEIAETLHVSLAQMFQYGKPTPGRAPKVGVSAACHSRPTIR